MERKIVLSLFYMGILTAVVGIVVTTFAYYGFFRREIEENLVHECRLVAESYDKLSSPDELEKYSGEDFRITLIDKDGSVLYESDADHMTMKNHLDRPEIRSAAKTGTGSDTRLSDTLGTEDHYYAVRLDDHSILRVSIQTDSIIALFERSLLIIVCIIIGIIFVAMIASVKLTEKLIAPLKRIPEILEKDTPLTDADLYPEVIPIVEEIRSARNAQSEMRQEFTANVSHELKTPLTSISGYAELIESGMAQGADSVEFAGRIRKESDRMLALIGDTHLDDVIDLKAVAEDCKERLSQQAQRRGIRITVSGESTVIKGSRTEITELVYELVDNAIKYDRENGNIEIETADKRLTVTDTGIGIPQESIPRIFERFYRIDKSRSRAKGGTGLGLSIVKHIAEHHGAAINVESTVGVGTSITVKFR